MSGDSSPMPCRADSVPHSCHTKSEPEVGRAFDSSRPCTAVCAPQRCFRARQQPAYNRAWRRQTRSRFTGCRVATKPSGWPAEASSSSSESSSSRPPPAPPCGPSFAIRASAAAGRGFRARCCDHQRDHSRAGRRDSAESAPPIHSVAGSAGRRQPSTQ